MDSTTGSDRTAVRRVETAADAERALGFVTRAESQAGSPLLDEAERRRLEAAAHDPAGNSGGGWSAHLGVVDEEVRGYAGASSGTDTVVDTDLVVAEPELAHPLLSEVESSLGQPLRVWLRHASAGDVRAVEGTGYTVARRLLVMGRSLEGPLPEPDLPGGVELRRYIPDHDDEPIADLLRQAYEGTPDGGWDVATFRARRALGWFRAEDLLVAEGRQADVAGIHWTKRRGGGIGEVYNLAVAPEAQGLGLGRALLAAGLRHLAEVGCSEVVLWVDEANLPAVELYVSAGFREKWADVALTRAG